MIVGETRNAAAPRPAKTRSAARNLERRNGTAPRPGIKSIEAPITHLAVEFARNCLEAERALLAAGWYDPVGLNNAAVQAELAGSHFAGPAHSFLFAALCYAAEEGQNLTVGWTCRLARKIGVALDDDYLFDLILMTDATPRALDMYAETVVELARRRQRALRCFRRYADVIGANGWEIIFRRRTLRRSTGG